MSNTGTVNRPFFSRVWIYFREMFPIHVYLPYVVALYFCLNLATQALCKTPIVIDVYGIVGIVSALAMMMLMRTFDDLKDVEIDKDLFPDRAIPRGDVKVMDIKTLSVTSFIILLIANLGFGHKTLLYFGIMIVYALLTFKWFFAEEIHRKNLTLTMITHQPVPLFINFFLIQTALHSGGMDYPFTWSHLVLLLMFTLPVTAWETGRKTRSADMETDYVTFSRIFGARGSSSISLVCLLLSGAFCLYTGIQIELPMSFMIICGVLFVAVIFFFGRFILYPTNKNNVLKNVTLGFTTVLFFNMLIHMLLKFTIHFNL